MTFVNITQAIFWLSALMMLYTFVVYPLTMVMIGLLAGRRTHPPIVTKGEHLSHPTVAIITATIPADFV